MSRDFLMPLLSESWRIINRKARLVMSVGMCLMAWRADDDETALHVIKRIPRDTTSLTFLLIIIQNTDSRGIRKSLLKVPTVVNFAVIV